MNTFCTQTSVLKFVGVSSSQHGNTAKSKRKNMDKNLLSNISNYYLSTSLKLEPQVLVVLYWDVHFSTKG